VTVDQEVKFKTCTALGETFKVQLIDTAGQERFRCVRAFALLGTAVDKYV
jgi:GTPase SAR1 family protein